MKHRSDLKHASAATARVEDKEKEARNDAKVTKDELRMAREELQAVRGDLWAKMAPWSWPAKKLQRWVTL